MLPASVEPLSPVTWQILELVQGRTVDLTIRFSRKQMGVVLPQQDGGA